MTDKKKKIDKVENKTTKEDIKKVQRTLRNAAGEQLKYPEDEVKGS